MNTKYFFFLCLVLSTLCFTCLASAQAPKTGDPVEVKIGDKIELAEFVSAGGNGSLIRVKLADGTMKLLPATHVRRPQGAASAPKPAKSSRKLHSRRDG